MLISYVDFVHQRILILYIQKTGINKTQFVSNQTNEKLAQADIVGTTITNFSNLNMSVTIPTLPTPNEKYVFARIGVRIVGVEDWIYSPIRKITL